MAIGFGIIIVIMLMKYKPMYEVSISDNKLGYINNKTQFEETIEPELININGNNANFVTLNEMPKYELKLVNRNKQSNEKEILAALNENSTVTYKYFAVTVENKAKAYVDTFEDAEKVVEDIKNQYDNKVDLDLKVVEKYTENKNEIGVDTLEIAENNIVKEVESIIEKNKYASINGIKIGSMPLDSNTRILISSRFGSISSIRRSAHTGLDMACALGTEIKAIANGTITYAKWDGGYGNIVRISHGNGVETWYAHCSQIFVEEGQTVEAGDIIAAVGSTGNSTGPHLHLEVRINGVATNPQLYFYK